ncbi:hypothetical protein LUZ60_015268 [Juncus effusus]|nr:hypothetical protein LUZ60_015268 [Juncus effusus]
MERGNEERERRDGFETPKRKEYKIPAVFSCPPPPKKKSTVLIGSRKRDPPINGYFQPPDLELIFAMAQRREACVS